MKIARTFSSLVILMRVKRIIADEPYTLKAQNIEGTENGSRVFFTTMTRNTYKNTDKHKNTRKHCTLYAKNFVR